MGAWAQAATCDGTSQNLSIFDAASPNAHSIVSLAVLTLFIVGLIFLVVEGILFYSVWRFRQRSDDPEGEPPQVYGSQPVEVAWTAAPTMIVFFLVLVTTRTLWEVLPTPPEPRVGDNAVFVRVIGHQWWWEYVYETYNGRDLGGIITAGELHMPVSDDGTPRPVHLTLQSADVCHSFWVPRLGGKMDVIPGRTNHLVLQTNEVGWHLGQCAEYCGTQHAGMLIRVIAESPDDFQTWLDNQAKPAVEDPAVVDGKRAFLAQTCVSCHRIRGTAAAGTYAPDLTHLMSRRTLASGLITNTPAHLADWVHDPQTIKPGCLMPAFGLSTADDELIVSYLRTLQ
jgi:cytochrome c oxidase subunit II